MGRYCFSVLMIKDFLPEDVFLIDNNFIIGYNINHYLPQDTKQK